MPYKSTSIFVKAVAFCFWNASKKRRDCYLLIVGWRRNGAAAPVIG